MLHVTIILVCFMLVVPAGTISMHIAVILVVMLKSAILLPKNSMFPIWPLNKNYLRNYLEPKNYLEAPEWQDDSWSGKFPYTNDSYVICIEVQKHRFHQENCNMCKIPRENSNQKKTAICPLFPSNDQTSLQGQHRSN
jgi:hypothetical protein